MDDDFPDTQIKDSEHRLGLFVQINCDVPDQILWPGKEIAKQSSELTLASSYYLPGPRPGVALVDR